MGAVTVGGVVSIAVDEDGEEITNFEAEGERFTLGEPLMGFGECLIKLLDRVVA